MATWQLKRDDTGEVIELHRQYHWINEHDWTPLAQSEPVYTLSGAVDIQQGTKKAGRPITLDSEYARIIRADLDKLQEWSAAPELTMQLTHPNAAVYSVVFDRPALTNVKPVKRIRPEDEQPSDPHFADINFIVI